jgi:D-glycero-D-manno-heptose 1,7-bisphosphate phosphatase
MRRPAIFLDRDGVLIENIDTYVREWADVSFFPFTGPAMRRAAAWPHAFVIVTNQALIAKGIRSAAHIESINNGVADAVRSMGGRIDAAYLCPHGPADGCDCRKPMPGMLLRAATALNLDLADSYMIGDAITDMGAARAAGVRGVLVKTGRGARELDSFCQTGHDAWFDVVDTLEDALEHVWIRNTSSRTI